MRSPHDTPRYSAHAARRTGARGLSPAAIDAALRWGRRYWSHGDQVFRLDHRSVVQAREAGVRVDAHEGVTVVLTADGVVRTAWRHRSPGRIKR